MSKSNRLQKKIIERGSRREKESPPKSSTKRSRRESRKEFGSSHTPDPRPKEKILGSAGALSSEAIRNLSQEILDGLKSGNFDSVMKQMVMVAVGDVVGLGYMTREEYDAPEEYTDDGLCIKQSGASKALWFAPPRLRAKMMSELAPFFLAKKKEKEDRTGMPDPEVVFYVPDNGRDK